MHFEFDDALNVQWYMFYGSEITGDRCVTSGIILNAIQMNPNDSIERTEVYTTVHH